MATCGKCSKAGFFLSLDKAGLCADCAKWFQAETTHLRKAVREAVQTVNGSNDIGEKLAACETMLSLTGRLRAVERLGTEIIEGESVVQAMRKIEAHRARLIEEGSKPSKQAEPENPYSRPARVSTLVLPGPPAFEWDLADTIALDEIRAILNAVEASGLTMREFKHKAEAVLPQFRDADCAALVWTSNIANARSARRCAALFAPEHIEEAPYWEFAAIDDSRNDEEGECPDRRCQWLNGKIFRKDDIPARAFLPPIHFGCRCMTIERDEDEKKRRVTRGDKIPFKPLHGWDGRRFWSQDDVPFPVVILPYRREPEPKDGNE